MQSAIEEGSVGGREKRWSKDRTKRKKKRVIDSLWCLVYLLSILLFVQQWYIPYHHGWHLIVMFTNTWKCISLIDHWVVSALWVRKENFFFPNSAHELQARKVVPMLPFLVFFFFFFVHFTSFLSFPFYPFFSLHALTSSLLLYTLSFYSLVTLFHSLCPCSYFLF